MSWDDEKEEMTKDFKLRMTLGELEEFGELRIKGIAAELEEAERARVNDPDFWNRLKRAGALLGGLIDIGVQGGFVQYAPDETRLDTDALDEAEKELEE